jgi:hypothetical protein
LLVEQKGASYLKIYSVGTNEIAYKNEVELEIPTVRFLPSLWFGLELLSETQKAFSYLKITKGLSRFF